jgi:hypothetical protein
MAAGTDSTCICNSQSIKCFGLPQIVDATNNIPTSLVNKIDFISVGYKEACISVHRKMLC